MINMNAWKIFQRQLYDILSNKYYLILFFLFIYTSLISVLHFCEVWLSGSSVSRNNMNQNFIDNISGKNIQEKLCQYSPIDVVYTWVNGSDPAFIHQLRLIEKRLQKESSLSCSFSDCFPSHFTAFKTKESETNHILNHLSYISLTTLNIKGKNWTLLRWDSLKTAEEQSEKMYEVDGKSVESFLVHWTTDETASSFYLPSNTIAIKGVNKGLEFVTKEMLDQLLEQATSSVWRYPKVIFVELSSQLEVQQLLKGKKWNLVFINRSMKLNITKAGLSLELPSINQYDDMAASRYDDKEELRYSLRSLEKYAPWVRKIFIVTNGQLPHWLDLSNPRVQIVTHESIFTNSSHLPTFSSPSIEAHIHRIPGLSDKFIYFNDDIFLGDYILPEDFFTFRGGQKVYLSWPVPDCSAVCPWTWVGDGTCDTPCNSSVCDFDGGDCLSSQSKSLQHHSSDEDYIENTYDFFNTLNQTIQSHHPLGYYKADRISTEKPLNSSNNIFSIHSGDGDFNNLLGLLVLNGTKLTSDIVQNRFLLSKKDFLNHTQLNFKERDVKENTLTTPIRTSHKHRKATKMRGKLHRALELKKDKRKELFSKVGRSILNNNRTNIYNNSVGEPMDKTKYLKFNRVISPMHLSRAQVGVPPIGVAESFYSFKPEISSLRNKQDTFAESMLYVNALLNKRYGYKARKVPSHMPHLIDKDIMFHLQNVFPEEYNKTSSHYFRHPQDMQFSFSYFYHLMSEEIDVAMSEIFDTFDTDDSGTWSDRELRTVLTRVYDLPLQRSSVLSLETALLFCAKDFHYNHPPPPPPYERYLDSKLPLVTKQLVENCTIISDLLGRKMGKKKRYLYTLVNTATREATVAFHMLTSNISQVLNALDKIRRSPKKFICLNDNLDPLHEDNQLIRAVLVDFFHSLFPKPSQFELAADYRNRYLYYKDFLLWQTNKKKVAVIIYSILIVTIIFIFHCLFHKECYRLQYKSKKKLMKVVQSIKLGREKTGNRTETYKPVIV